MAATLLILIVVSALGGLWIAHLPRAASRVDRVLSLLPPACESDAWSHRRIIAHAGGAVEGVTYSNSGEAIVASAEQGCRYQEVDFEWTRDGALVALHDWNAATLRIFGPPLARRQLSRAEFLGARRRDGLTSLDLQAALAAVGAVREGVIVPDFKWREAEAALELERVLASLPVERRPAVALQIYSEEQIGLAQELGFEEEVLTLYRSRLTDREVVALVREGAVRALTLPAQRALGDLPAMLAGSEVDLYAHTVNSTWLAQRLFDRGIDGIYSDRLCGCRGAQ